MTSKQLSITLDLSAKTVYEQVRKLERNGIIEKYTVLLNGKLLGKELLVFTHVKLVRHSKENIANFEKQISQINEVHECHHISGDYDYILKMSFNGMDDYRNFMFNKLTAITSSGSTHRIFVIIEVKNEIGYRF